MRKAMTGTPQDEHMKDFLNGFKLSPKLTNFDYYMESLLSACNKFNPKENSELNNIKEVFNNAGIKI
jgi:hypothetical protein